MHWTPLWISHVINCANLYAINGAIGTKASVLMERRLQQLRHLRLAAAPVSGLGIFTYRRALEKLGWLLASKRDPDRWPRWPGLFVLSPLSVSLSWKREAEDQTGVLGPTDWWRPSLSLPCKALGPRSQKATLALGRFSALSHKGSIWEYPRLSGREKPFDSSPFPLRNIWWGGER